MDCQQHINLELCRRFEEMGVEFAYPTRTLHIATGGGPVSEPVAVRGS
jgi:small-conductance mechanosensitive channel